MPGPLWQRISSLLQWLNQRTGASAIVPFLRKKEVPRHRHSVWYYLGGMILFLFLLQAATGVLLLFYYRPSMDEAYESVRFIMAEVQFGWLVRSIHAWGANLMILTVFIHLFSVLLLKAYRSPRELTWISGVLLLGVALALGFTGYLLPWNELAYFATRVGTEIPGALPVVGPFLREVFRGGEDVGGATLTRFYALHISVLPGLGFFLIALHVILVQRHGMSVPPDVERQGGPRGSHRFFPNFLLRDLIGWLLALAVLSALAAFFPAHLGEKADPFAPAPVGIKPEWYFMFMFQTLRLLPSHIFGLEGEMLGVVAFGIAGIALLLLPFLDRSKAPRKGWDAWSYIGSAVILYVIVMTYIGYAGDAAH